MTNELPLKDSSSTSFVSRSILRHQTSGISAKRKGQTHNDLKLKHKKKTSEGILRRVSSSWSVFLGRLRTLSNHIFSTDEFVEDLFVDESSLSMIERIDKHSRGVTKTEEEFLNEYSKVKSLDKLYERAQEEAVPEAGASTFALQDVMRDAKYAATDGEVIDDEDEVSLRDIDADSLGRVLASQDYARSSVKSSSKATAHSNTNNVGEMLWEYRRAKWLTPKKLSQDSEERIAQSSLSHVPIESYDKVYKNLIDKGRSLKDDKAINLKDLIKVINHGWIASEKWERAAKGIA